MQQDKYSLQSPRGIAQGDRWIRGLGSGLFRPHRHNQRLAERRVARASRISRSDGNGFHVLKSNQNS